MLKIYEIPIVSLINASLAVLWLREINEIKSGDKSL